MNNKVKCVFALGAFIILSILGYLLLPEEENTVLKNEEVDDDYIFVHIEGCVENPGLVKIKYGARLYELIDEVGGATDLADLSRVNLASIVSDEQKIFIPEKVIAEDDADDDVGMVNINTASKEKLMTLDGIGEGTAEKIIKYREENGYFNVIEDLMNVSGIGESKFNSIKNDIVI